MDRRQFLGSAGKGVLGAAAVSLAACNQATDAGATTLAAEAAGDNSLPQVEWQMATSWPAALDTIFGGAIYFSERVSALSGGRFVVDAREGGELVPALEVLQSVQSGGVQSGHTASYYYTGLSPVTAFGTALPFGLTYREQNAWLYAGGGLAQLQEYYAATFNTIQFPAGNTGVQMGGWFNKEINSVADLQGLRFRTAGLNAQVLSKLGVQVQTLPGAEIFQALQTGAIDAAEWVGPYDDQKLDFPAVAQFYYYPGFWEPAPTLEVQIGLDQWNQLPSLYQDIIRSAAKEANMNMMNQYDLLNPAALREMVESGDVELRPFPDDVLAAAEEAAFELYDEIGAQTPEFAEVFEGWNTFRQTTHEWFGVAERAYLSYAAQPPA
ncbi:MAG: TRAP transporter substrate-binding protein [Acidimicrobiia bacterium]